MQQHRMIAPISPSRIQSQVRRFRAGGGSGGRLDIRQSGEVGGNSQGVRVSLGGGTYAGGGVVGGNEGAGAGVVPVAGAARERRSAPQFSQKRLPGSFDAPQF